MPRFVALLRGVNVGKANRIAMEAFKRLMQDICFSDVRTLLNSGNAVFTSTARSPDAHARAIETALQEGFGLSIKVVVKSSSAFEAAVVGNPIVPQAEDHSQFLVAFSQDPQRVQRLTVLASLVQPPERFHIGKHAAYLHCARGMLKSKAASALLGKAGHGVTTRNWATVLKLNDLLHASRA